MVPEPMEDRGKRIRTDMQSHDPTVLHQDPRMFKEPNASSSVGQSRFGAGFSRRQGADIQSDAPRKELEEKHRVQHEKQSEARRVRAAGRNFSQYDPITGNPTTIGQHFPAAKPVSNTQPEVLHKAMRWPETRDSSVLPNTAMDQRKAQWLTQQQSRDPPANRRLERLQNEGLTTTKREWSVAQQMKCNDGYVLPKV